MHDQETNIDKQITTVSFAGVSLTIVTKYAVHLQPKFMTKKQREQLAIKRREEEISLQKAR